MICVCEKRRTESTNSSALSYVPGSNTKALFDVASSGMLGPLAAEVESFGKHVNGKSYNYKYHFLIVLKDGKFKEVKEYMDTLHLHDLLQK